MAFVLEDPSLLHVRGHGFDVVTVTLLVTAACFHSDSGYWTCIFPDAESHVAAHRPFRSLIGAACPGWSWRLGPTTDHPTTLPGCLQHSFSMLHIRHNDPSDGRPLLGHRIWPVCDIKRSLHGVGDTYRPCDDINYPSKHR